MADDRLLSTSEAAEYLGLAASTLVNMRVDRRGPQFVKMGAGKVARVKYRESALVAYLQSCVVGTSDQPRPAKGGAAC